MRKGRLLYFGLSFCSMVGLGVLLGGCASDDDSARFSGGAGGHHGGQTGSLVPSCGIADELGSVPAGDGAVIVHTSGCAAQSTLEQIQLSDKDGNAIGFEAIVLEDGAILLRTDRALQPGEYVVSTGMGSEKDLVVTEAEPLPMRLGELRGVEGGTCPATFELVLDDSALAYKNLLKLWVSVDGSDPIAWVDYGALEVNDGRAELVLQQCAAGCLEDGLHTLEVTATIAGEEMQPEPISEQFEIACPRHESSEMQCQVSFFRFSSGPFWYGLLGLLGPFVMGLRRITRRSAQ